MSYDFSIKEDKKIRVIISTDTKNEVDDQFAIVHALLSPKLMVKGIIANHFEKMQEVGSMEASYDEIKKVLKIMVRNEVPVLEGSKNGMIDEENYRSSEGAKFIVEEAMKEDSSPLYVLLIGSLTDIAIAYLMNPEIATKLTAVWVGGGTYPNGNPEFNIMNDVTAAKIVFKSDLPLWQLPANVCACLEASFSELQCRVKPFGEVGKYLFEEMLRVYNRVGWHESECWTLWDSAGVGALLCNHSFIYKTIKAPLISDEMMYIHHGDNREIRVYEKINERFIMEDFYCKLKINYDKQD